jgi:hypothetical protein
VKFEALVELYPAVCCEMFPKLALGFIPEIFMKKCLDLILQTFIVFFQVLSKINQLIFAWQLMKLPEASRRVSIIMP